MSNKILFWAVDNVEVIEFTTGEGKIRINKKHTKTYNNQTRYDFAFADNAEVWHMVVVSTAHFQNEKSTEDKFVADYFQVHHEGKYEQAEIMERIFNVADNVDCYIVGYRVSQLKSILWEETASFITIILALPPRRLFPHSTMSPVHRQTFSSMSESENAKGSLPLLYRQIECCRLQVGSGKANGVRHVQNMHVMSVLTHF